MKIFNTLKKTRVSKTFLMRYFSGWSGSGTVRTVVYLLISWFDERRKAGGGEEKEKGEKK